MAGHESTDFLDALAGAPSMNTPLDDDEREYFRLVAEHPELICPTCRAPFWHPRLKGALERGAPS